MSIQDSIQENIDFNFDEIDETIFNFDKEIEEIDNLINSGWFSWYVLMLLGCILAIFLLKEIICDMIWSILSACWNKPCSSNLLANK